MNKHVLLIDMYGVILEESKGNFIPYTLSCFNKIEHERLLRQIKTEKLFTKAGIGEISSNIFLSMLGFDNPEFHMKNYIENYLTLDKGFVPFAEKFYKDYDFVLLSNDVLEWSLYITEYYELNKYFKHKIVSGDVKCRKPEEKIYELTLKKINRNPSDCYFIDNSVKNLGVAQAFGITPILFNRDNEDYQGIVVNSFDELSKKLLQ